MSTFSANLELLVRCDKDHYAKNTEGLEKMYQEYLGTFKALGAAKPAGAMCQLILEGMDEEQICEQVILLENDMQQTYAKITDEDLTAIGLAGFPTLHKQFLDDSSISANRNNKKSSKQLSDAEGLSDDSDSGNDLDSDEEGMASDMEENDGEMGSDEDDDINSDEDERMGSDEETGSDEEENDGEANMSSSLDEGMEGSDGELEEEKQDSEDGSDDEEHNDDEEQDSDDEGRDSDDEGSKAKNSENSDDSDDSAYDELDKQLFEKYVKNSDDDDDDSEGESDVEDLAIASGEEDSDEENDANNEPINEEDSEDDNNETEPDKKRMKLETGSKKSKGNPLSHLVVPAFSKTSVDSDFFNVRESEWIADQDIIGASNFGDIDFMEDIDDGHDEKATYADFFDAAPATSDTKKNKKARKRKEGRKEDGEENDNDEEPSSWGLEEDNDHTTESSTLGEKTTNTADQVKSRMESELEKEMWLRGQLEESNVSAKPWELKGEVRAADRPKDSTLTESLNFQCGQMSRPEINDKVEKMLEKIALSRFRSGVFDDVERKARLVENPFEFKKKLVLNQEKSTKSLSKIYEEEHLQKERQNKAEKDNEELPEYREYRKMYEEFDELMNALFHVHYTPKMKRAEVKIVSNLPALRVEEVTPLVVGTGAMLAPQEILAPLRGDLKGDAEKTDTDKKRERREKKHRQHLKHKEADRKIDSRVKKADKDGKKLDVSTTAKVVKRAIKTGQVKLMDTTGASTKSSTSFFKQLHEVHTAASTAHAKRKRNAKP